MRIELLVLLLPQDKWTIGDAGTHGGTAARTVRLVVDAVPRDATIPQYDVTEADNRCTSLSLQNLTEQWRIHTKWRLLNAAKQQSCIRYSALLGFVIALRFLNTVSGNKTKCCVCARWWWCESRTEVIGGKNREKNYTVKPLRCDVRQKYAHCAVSVF